MCPLRSGSVFRLSSTPRVHKIIAAQLSHPLPPPPRPLDSVFWTLHLTAHLGVAARGDFEQHVAVEEAAALAVCIVAITAATTLARTRRALVFLLQPRNSTAENPRATIRKNYAALDYIVIFSPIFIGFFCGYFCGFCLFRKGNPLTRWTAESASARRCGCETLKRLWCCHWRCEREYRLAVCADKDGRLTSRVSLIFVPKKKKMSTSKRRTETEKVVIEFGI